MKDIKGALQQRLEAIDKKMDFEKQRHQAALERLERDRSVVKAMIALEDSTAEDTQAELFSPKPPPIRETTGAELESHISTLLKNQKDWAHADIKARLIKAGLGVDYDPQFGRRVQGTLLSMLSRGLVEKGDTRQWRAAKKDSAAA